MPTFKICVFEHHQRKDGKYRVSIRLGHKRQSAYLRTDIYVTRKQICPGFKGIKEMDVIRNIDRDILNYEKRLLHDLGSNLDRFTAKELVTFIERHTATEGGANIDFIAFTSDYTAKLKTTGHTGSASRFNAVTRNLIDYFGREIIYIKEINVKNLQGFIEYMQKPRIIRRVNQHGNEVISQKNGCKNQTIKDYLADIQTLFNLACIEYNDEDAATALITHHPFHSKKLQIEINEEPKKRDLSVEDLITILKAEIVPGQRMQLARDVLALSFYLLAINTADLYGVDALLAFRRIDYHRQKTSPRRKDDAFFSVKIEPEALPLIRKYRDPAKKRLFLFYKMYSNFRIFNRNVNEGCKQLAEYLKIKSDLTTYYMRHTWATVASEDCGISDTEIAIALNHVSDAGDIKTGKNLKVTRGYIHRRFTKNDINHRKVLNFINTARRKLSD